MNPDHEALKTLVPMATPFITAIIDTWIKPKVTGLIGSRNLDREFQEHAVINEFEEYLEWAYEKHSTPIPVRNDLSQINCVSDTPLETKRLLLEPITQVHASALYTSLQDTRIYTFIPPEPPKSMDALENRYQLLSSRLSPDKRKGWLNWAAHLRQTDTYVGVFEATVYESRLADLAYIVFPQHWRHGYAKEACEVIIEYLFNDCGVTTISAEIDTRNTASIQLVVSLGFNRVSFTRDADFFKGNASDEYRYELRNDADQRLP